MNENVYTPEQIAQSQAIGELHYEWVGKHLESATFDPVARPESGDYNVHHVDVDAGAEAEAELAQAAANL